MTAQCEMCGAYVEPFIVLCKLMDNWEQVNHQLDIAYQKIDEIKHYKPHLNVAKKIEQRIREGRYRTSPVCTKCGESVDLVDLANGVWKQEVDYDSFWDRASKQAGFDD